MSKHRILFVCHGNICRSAMAEFIMSDRVRRAGREHDFIIASAATSAEELGHDMYPPAKACLRRHGIAFSPRQARQITHADYRQYDRIFVMDDNNLRWLRRLGFDDPGHKVVKLMTLVGLDRDVADPWYTGDFERTFADLTLAIDALLKQV